jgi:murein DD-endopeptidase MepM/ murein hydrolase activator NlpD
MLDDLSGAPAGNPGPQRTAARTIASGATVSALLVSTALAAAPALAVNTVGDTAGTLFTPKVSPDPALKTVKPAAVKEFVPSSAPAQWWKWWNGDKSKTGYFYGTGSDLNAFMAAGAKTSQPQRVSTDIPYVDPTAPKQIWRYWNKAGTTGFYTGTGAQLNTFLNAYLGGASVQSALKLAGGSSTPTTTPKPAAATPAPAKSAATAPAAPATKPAAVAPKPSAAPSPVSAPVTKPTVSAPVTKPTAAAPKPAAPAPVATRAAASAPISVPTAPATAPSKASTTTPAVAKPTAYVDDAAPAQWWSYWEKQGGAKVSFYGTGKQLNVFLNAYFATGDKTAATALAAKLGPLAPAAATAPTTKAPTATKPAATTPAPTAPAATAPAAKAYVDDAAPAQWWSYWEKQGGAKVSFYGTGKQLNVFLNAYFATGDKAAATALAAKLGPLAPASSTPAVTAPTTPAAPKPAATTPAATTPAAKAYVDATAPAQWWNYWNASGTKDTFFGTGKQLNVFLNAYLNGTDILAATTLAAKADTSVTPIAGTPPKVVDPATQTPAAPLVPTTPPASTPAVPTLNPVYTYGLYSSAATGAYGTAPAGLVAQIGLQRPSGGTITSGYGSRCLTAMGTCDVHTGLDFAAADGSSVRAAQTGRVIFAGWHAYGGGYRVEIDHGNGVVTTYNHLSRIDVSVGQIVQVGQNIAAQGSTGNAFGSHLHFEVLYNGAWTNPAAWLSS